MSNHSLEFFQLGTDLEDGQKYLIKDGLSTLDKRMTRKQALRYAYKTQNAASKRAGFIPVLFTANEEINGWYGLRINYTKQF